ncbi:MAG: Zn-ribbon domain-containing OB-fold protein [Deltaproteobacteria bacterium]|nr:Zn-ribbon domain-containing OB-fold protein [Deltaproteobacteria bacterium]
MAEKNEKPRTIHTVLRVPFEMALGPTWTRFFEGLREKKILGTKCKECGRILVPARPFCPRCFEPMEEWVEVAQEGTIITWSYVNYTYFGVTADMIPIVPTRIKLDGVDGGWGGRIGGFDIKDFDLVNKKVKVGARVKAVWSGERHGHLRDIEYWEIIE